MDPGFIKSYYRKAKALVGQDLLKEAVGQIDKCLELEADNEEFKEFRQKLLQEIQEDSLLPADNPDKEKFQALVDQLTAAGGDCSKVKLRYYSENNRGMHAACDIKQGETAIFIPYDSLLSMKKAYATEIGAKLLKSHETGLFTKLTNVGNTFLTSLILAESRKNTESEFWPYLTMLPPSCSNFP